MTNRKKQLSNSFSTGGGGNNFEMRVHAAFVTLMLSGGFAPCLPPWPIKEIKLQGKRLAYDIDDVIVFAERPDGKKVAKLHCQIKHSIGINKNKVLGEVIQAAWNDFNDARKFTAETDSIALITGPLSKTDINNVRTILDWARYKPLGEFFTEVKLAKYSSPVKQKKLEILREHINNANGGTAVSDKELWKFLKSFYLLGYDLDFKAGVTLSLLQTLIGQYSQKNAHSLWTQIFYEVGLYNQSGGTITRDSLPEVICSAFQKPVGKTIPAKLRPAKPRIKPSAPVVSNLNNIELAIINLLGGWDENT